MFLIGRLIVLLDTIVGLFTDVARSNPGTTFVSDDVVIGLGTRVN